MLLDGVLKKVRLSLDLSHCEHEYSWRGTDAARCRRLFLDHADLCVWLDQSRAASAPNSGAAASSEEEEEEAAAAAECFGEAHSVQVE